MRRVGTDHGKSAFLAQASERHLVSARTLGQKLGSLHDLAFFGIRLQTGQDEGEDERAMLLDLICTRENELQEIAFDLGARFFAEKPGAFEKRLLRYARDWPQRPA